MKKAKAKLKGGRPPLFAGELIKSVGIGLRPSTAQKLKDEAKALKISVSAFVECALEHEFRRLERTRKKSEET